MSVTAGKAPAEARAKPAPKPEADAQRPAAFDPAAPDRAALRAALGAGQPLDGSTRSRAERAYGTDLAAVRVHTGATAAGLASRLNAYAFAVGDDIGFAHTAYRPETIAGKALLAHELAHVVQQRREDARGDEFDVERDADIAAGRLLASQPPGAARPRRATGLSLQRCEVPKPSAAVRELAAERQKAARQELVGLEMTGELSGGEEARSFFHFSTLLAEGIVQLQTGLGQIANRSLMFTQDIDRKQGAIAALWGLLEEASRAAREAQALEGAAGAAKLEEAAARYEAIVLGLAVMSMEVNYLLVADAAETAGQVGLEWGRTLERLGRENQPYYTAFASLDRKQIATAAQAWQTRAPELQADLEKWVKDLQTGARHSRRALQIANAVMLTLSAYQAARAIGGAGGGPGAMFRMPPIGAVGAGGAATGVTFTVSAEVLESIRQLIRIGAISNAVLSAGAGAPVTIAPPGRPMMMAQATPSGDVTPSSGTRGGTPQKYGDLRNKHTKLGDRTQAEVEQAVDDAKKGSPPSDPSLRGLTDAIGKKDINYGSQLSKEAVDQYKDLVKDALENGTPKGATKIEHIATFKVGIDVKTGLPTRNFAMNWSSKLGGWHIYPVPPTPSISP